MAEPSPGPPVRPARSRFERRPGPNADPFTRQDESLAFQGGDWSPPPWFDRVAVVLFETTDSVNIGGVVRVMANTGFSRLRLVNPAPYDPWDVVGVAHYTQHIVEGAARYSTLPPALEDASLVVGLSGKHHRAQRNLVAMRTAAERIARTAQEGGAVALLFGREDTGLPNEALDRCHLVATIPANPAYPSFNLAQATLLTLYALFELAQGHQQALRPPKRSAPLATAAALEDLFADLERALEAVQFFKDRSRVGTMRSLRAALARASLDAREAGLMRAATIEVRRFLLRRGILTDLGPVGARPVDAPPRLVPPDGTPSSPPENP